MSPTDIVVILIVALVAVVGYTSGMWGRELKAIAGTTTVIK